MKTAPAFRKSAANTFRRREDLASATLEPATPLLPFGFTHESLKDFRYRLRRERKRERRWNLASARAWEARMEDQHFAMLDWLDKEERRANKAGLVPA